MPTGTATVARLLIEGQAPTSTVSSAKGFTPLMFAARNGDIEMAKMLIAAGANVNEPGADGTHVLPFAIVHGQDDFAMFLLEQGADPNARDRRRPRAARRGRQRRYSG